MTTSAPVTLSVTETILNSSAIMLTWTAPPLSPGRDLLAYNICYVRPDGTSKKARVSADQHSVVISDLRPGSYTFNISALYSDGSSSPVHSISVVLEGGGTNSGVLGRSWFFAAVGVAGVVFVVVVLILVTCICCLLCRTVRSYKGMSSKESVAIIID